MYAMCVCVCSCALIWLPIEMEFLLLSMQMQLQKGTEQYSLIDLLNCIRSGSSFNLRKLRNEQIDLV